MAGVVCLIEPWAMGSGIKGCGDGGGVFLERKGNQTRGPWEDTLQNKEAVAAQEIHTE